MTTLGLVSRRRIHGLRGSRGAAAASLAAVATLGATAVGQAAQVPSGAVAASPKPPAYRPLRQDENWHALAGTSRTGIDTVKYMPLREDEAIWLSLGGEARLRGELWDGFRFGNPPTAAADDTFLLSRLRLHGDLHVGPHVRAFVEGITAWTTERDLVGGRRASDVDSADVAQAFVDLRAPLIDDYNLTLRPGRQQFTFGRQRLVSFLPWSNSLRAWDGVSAIVDNKGFHATAFLTQFVPVQKYHFNDVSRGINFGGVHTTWQPNGARPGIDAYAYWLHRDVATFNGTNGDEERYTFGLRAWQPPAGGRLDYDAEFAWQTGEHAGNDIAALMVAAQVGHTFEARWSPRIWLGFDYASGDERSGGDVQTFNQLFPLGHAYLGYLDAIGRQNIIDASAGVELRLTDTFKTALDGHALWLADSSDALYDVGGTVLRAGGTARSRFVGVELDWTVSWQVDRHLCLLLGLSYLTAGSMVEQSGPSDDTAFAYMQSTLVF